MKSMELTKRESLILEKIVKEYIENGKPVSSQFLYEKYDFGIKEAMIRKELQKMTELGLISQEHTSGGRIPTDKAYRFFVNKILEDLESRKDEIFFDDLKDFLKKDLEDFYSFGQEITRMISKMSSTITILGILDKDLIFKNGWEEIFDDYFELEEKGLYLNLASFVKNFEKNLNKIYQKITKDFEKPNQKIKVYIGKENPFSKEDDFSLILSQCCFNNKNGILSLIGPKRMNYPKNLKLINSLLNVLERL
jgi:transcriptional regulator of heat shock response